TRFRTSVNVGVDITWDELQKRYDAVLIATGAMVPRDLAVTGRELEGVHFAMNYLAQSNKVVAGDQVESQIDASGKHVIILGGGDTGADCLGTSTRQGALSVTTLAIGTQPPLERTSDQPWPMMPNLFEVASAHEEFGERKYLHSTVEFVGENGVLKGVKVADTEFVDGKRVPKAGTERILPADLVFLALGFVGPETQELSTQLATPMDSRGNVARDGRYKVADGLFAAGDAGRGQSLIVWAIAEGRAAAAAIDEYLEGETGLPFPVKPTDRPISVYS
ncbi:MAG: FAD-dependent oxidoreductase, partial [Aquiluna sp.]|nr:FAD-dependent oxidoreductase [Aquiluna sp.]